MAYAGRLAEGLGHAISYIILRGAASHEGDGSAGATGFIRGFPSAGVLSRIYRSASGRPQASEPQRKSHVGLCRWHTCCNTRVCLPLRNVCTVRKICNVQPCKTCVVKVCVGMTAKSYAFDVGISVTYRFAVFYYDMTVIPNRGPFFVRCCNRDWHDACNGT